MKYLIQKFGGTSLADDEKRRKVASIVLEAKHNGFLPVVVVSAIGRPEIPMPPIHFIYAREHKKS